MKTNNYERLNLRLSKDIYAKVEDESKKQFKSKSVLIEEALKDFFDKNNERNELLKDLRTFRVRLGEIEKKTDVMLELANSVLMFYKDNINLVATESYESQLLLEAKNHVKKRITKAKQKADNKKN